MNEKQTNELLRQITIIPGLMVGKPTIRGMRFPVVDIFEMLASGTKEDEILKQHPILEQADISAALLYATFQKKRQV